MEIKIGAAEDAYFTGAQRKLETESSVLISSSPYLNDGELRNLVAQEMLRRNGADLPNTAFIPDVARKLFQYENFPRLMELFELEKARLPEFKRWLDDKHLADYRIDQVSHCAPGTLGAALHDFMVNSGYQLDIFYQEIEVTNDFTFYLRQVALTHDIEHIVSGFGPNHGGELALLVGNMYAKAKYFHPELAAFFNRIQSFLRAKTVMKDALFYPEAHVLSLEAEYVGVCQARNWKMPLMLVDWRKYTDTPIDEIRREIGIDPVPEEGLWADTNRLCDDHLMYANENNPMATAAE